MNCIELRMIDMRLFGLLNLHFEPLPGRWAESPSTVAKEHLQDQNIQIISILDCFQISMEFFMESKTGYEIFM